MPSGFFPIIYVRGYAMRQDEIDETAADPFCGLNVGSTVERADERTAAPEAFAFEGPLVRLMHDYRYSDTIHQGRHNDPGPPADAWPSRRTIWIFRYYDDTSSLTGTGRDRKLLHEVAFELYQFIGRVRQLTGSRLVHLVAHSMGGLVCRSLLQKIYPEQAAGAEAAQRGRDAQDEIARLFTYATPHGGIHFRNQVVDLANHVSLLGFWGADVFHPRRMFEYLRPAGTPPPRVFDPAELTGFPLEDVFCLVGTNARDYPVARGIVRHLIGPASDGLVQIEHAAVRNAKQARIHRSHSGPFGIVNSAEGYHHLRTFLFGTIALTIDLELPPGASDAQRPRHLDVRASLPGNTGLVHEAVRGHFCPALLPDAGEGPVSLGLLHLHLGADASRTTNFRMQLGLYRQAPVAGGPEDRSAGTPVYHAIPDWVGHIDVAVHDRQRAAATGRRSTAQVSVRRPLILARWNDEQYRTIGDDGLPFPEGFTLLPPGTRLTLRLRGQEPGHDTSGPPATFGPDTGAGFRPEEVTTRVVREESMGA